MDDYWVIMTSHLGNFLGHHAAKISFVFSHWSVQALYDTNELAGAVYV